MGSGCGCKQGSSRGSPNGHFQASHPQLTLDLLHAAAGEVSKMRMNEESYGFTNTSRPLAPPRKPVSVSVPLKNLEADAVVYQQLQASEVSTSSTTFDFVEVSFVSLLCLLWDFVFIQFLNLRRQQIIQQINTVARMGQTKCSAGQYQPQVPPNKGRNTEFFNGRNCRSTTGLSIQTTWAPPPRKHSMNPPPKVSGMRAVFLGAPGGKRECAGTGVFLPRQQSGTVSENRKKPGL